MRQLWKIALLSAVRVRVKYSATHFGSWVDGGSGTATASTTATAIGGSHQRCTTCATYAT